jgi:hypothetical protein
MPSTAAKSATGSSAKVSLVLAGSILVLCFLLGGGFVWWYVQRVNQPTRVTLTPDEMTTMQNAGRQLTIADNGGARLNLSGPSTLQRNLTFRVQTPTDPDGVFTVGMYQVIRAGSVLVRVQPASAGQPPALIFRQRTWGLLMDAPTFTIARRIVHEPPLAKQLAVTPRQLDVLTQIVAAPALKGVYLSALPMPDTDKATALKAWTDYQASMASKDANAIKQAPAAMLMIVRNIGSAAMARAKKEYSDADNAIRQALSSTQIDAYHQGKTLQ